MEELTSKQRAQLRGLANSIDTILHVGKDGIGDNLAKQADDALEARELIKGKVLENSMLSAREGAEELAKAMDMSVERVREIQRMAQEPASLESPVGEEEDSSLGDFVADENAEAPGKAADRAMVAQQINLALKSLTPREEKVIRLRFGLDDGRARTLEEVGKEFNVTRERIRQIEAKALRKLRHPSRSRKLKDYLD